MSELDKQRSLYVAAGGSLKEKLAAQRRDADENAFDDDRLPLHEVRWGSPLSYQAHPLQAIQWLHGKSQHDHRTLFITCLHLLHSLPTHIFGSAYGNRPCCEYSNPVCCQS